MKRKRRKKMLFLAALFASPAFAAYEVGETVADMCWKDLGERSVCLSDAPRDIRVLLYNAGYCPPCNTEFQELVPKVREFDGKPVTFISLSEAGWAGGLKPTPQFLREWQEKYSIPFAVAASPGDAGSAFGSEDIPFVAVIDRTGKLAWKASMPGVDAIFNEVRSLLATPKTVH